MQRADIPEDELRRLYREVGLSQEALGDHFGVSGKTIYNRMQEYGIEARSCGHPRKVTADEEELRRLYWDEGYTLDDLSGHFDCTHAAVLRFMDRYGIERRSKGSGTAVPYATRNLDERGYVEWDIGRDLPKQYEHRLVAIVEHGLDAVAGKVVHHKNEIPWDNRPSNLQLMTNEEHVRHHNELGAAHG